LTLALTLRGLTSVNIILRTLLTALQGYALHVQGAVCEWLMGSLFIIYCLLFLPEFSKFTIHVKLQPDQIDNELLARPGERTFLL